jgi:hypothetical protein
MDPYLETPGLWPDVHHGLISEIQAQLNRRLRPKYHVRVEERVYISDENDPGRKAIVADVQIAESPKSLPTPSYSNSESTAVAEPLLMTTMIEDEIREARVEIIDANGRSVVAVIEVLSPTNKIKGSRGRASYEEKRREVMMSPSHLIEIDLLREGDHIHTRELFPPADYYVHVSRTGDRPKGYVWPILLTQRLPVIFIPLKPEDPDAELDLQAVLNTAYDRAAYDLVVDYTRQPVPPLTDETAAWATELLRAKGLRGEQGAGSKEQGAESDSHLTPNT